ncbi:hypothetical protein [Pseudonocardia sp. N23]|uniref:hypothetical protein n=1 Tax=Pseudonocardia sp. N23 TaxID=1987376 RepID=UPI000BFDE746|nr:hypothetical protein [Pseudonocardia sp. N23]GAY08383.1 hypothetical protein TOK_1940 [Pseudonocardia sp. N23]
MTATGELVEELLYIDGERVPAKECGTVESINPYLGKPCWNDVWNERISVDFARRAYGVVIDPQTLEVDETATEGLSDLPELRQRRHQALPDRQPPRAAHRDDVPEVPDLAEGRAADRGGQLAAVPVGHPRLARLTRRAGRPRRTLA